MIGHRAGALPRASRPGTRLRRYVEKFMTRLLAAARQQTALTPAQFVGRYRERMTKNILIDARELTDPGHVVPQNP